MFGQLDGKLQTKIRLIKSGKNIGKKNETTIQQQAELELNSLYQKQLDSGYVLNIEEYKDPMFPMLAHKYQDKRHKVKFDQKSYYASRKLNGIRCFIFMKNGLVTLFESRSGKAFKFFKHLAKDLKGYEYFIDKDTKSKTLILDGELFNKDIPFEILCSLINSDEYIEVVDPKTNKVWTTFDVQFHCYDIIPLNLSPLSFFDRFIDHYSLPQTNSIIRVTNTEVHSEEEMTELAKVWIKEGFEGLMLRQADGFYEFGIRSLFLLKVKFFESEEFKVEDIYLAENDNTKVLFILQNHHNKNKPYSSFVSSLRGSKEFNMKYFQYKNRYIGKWCTVSYQALSSYNVPLFSQVEGFREGIEEDGIFYPLV